MITITIKKSKNGEYKRVTCEGHAGYAQAGNDIVCSAVSILVINAVNSIEKLTGTRLEAVSDEEKGLIDVWLTDKPEQGCTLLLDSMVLGLQNVEAQYGKRYLKLKFKEV